MFKFSLEFGGDKKSKPRRRSRGSTSSLRKYAAAQVNNLTNSMARSPRPADVDIQRGITALRARSREELQNNGYAKRIVKLYLQNVIGPQGIRLQPNPRDGRRGTLDTHAAAAISKAWAAWGKRGSPDVTHTMSWRTIQKLFMRSLFVDGEVILVRQDAWDGNPFRYAVRFVDPVQLDVELNRKLHNGRVIRMGVELDELGAPIAYHFSKHVRTDTDYRRTHREHERIEAHRVLHIFDPEWTYQTRGVPHLAVSLLDFHHLRGYRDGELIAARTAANKLGWFVDSPEGETFEGDDEDADGNPVIDIAEPGRYGRLRHGVELVETDAKHPTTQFSDFVKSTLQGAAAPTGALYNAISGDLEGVNFSSLRQGNLWAQDEWRDWQTLVTETLCEWVYNDWLPAALLTELRLDLASIDKYAEVVWRPRRWEHVQPKEQAVADTTKLSNRTASISELIIESGREPDEVFAQIAEDIRKLGELGITTEVSNEPEPEPEPATDPETGEPVTAGDPADD